MTQLRHAQLPAYPAGALPTPEVDVLIVSVSQSGVRTVLRGNGLAWVAEATGGNMLSQNNLGDLSDVAVARTNLQLAAGATATKATNPQAIAGIDNVAYMTPASVAAAIAAAISALGPLQPITGNAYADNYVENGYVD